MTSYYNEINPREAQRLRNLISSGLIAVGDVDERDIRDVAPDDLKSYNQCHFFAGIGGWSAALRLAGWPDNKPVWTGSCPCQPFSTAGTKNGVNDERHLWPSWFWLISQCRPAIIFGEQVASAIAYGWADSVFDDLEGEENTCGATILPSASVGLPTKRERLFFMANAEGARERREIIDLRSANEGQKGDLLRELIGRVETSWCDTDRGTKLFPRMADGLSIGVDKPCGFGNAIAPEVAAAFIMSTQTDAAINAIKKRVGV